MTLDTGAIIYKAFIPTLKMALCIGVGFAATKRGAMPPAGAKGISLVTMNVGLPCLIFSSMVSAFTPQSVKAFGPLVMVAIMYQSLGLLLAWIVREVVPVPKDFRWGILVMGVISNWGHLPTAVIQTVANQPPFNPDTDVDLGVAYIAIFIFVMNTTFFALGVHKICAWDFIDSRTIDDPEPFKQRWGARLQRLRSIVTRQHLPPKSKVRLSAPAGSPSIADVESGSPQTAFSEPHPDTPAVDNDNDNDKETTATLTAPTTPTLPSFHNKPSRAPSVHRTRRSVRQIAVSIIKQVPAPTWAVMSGLIISLVQPLKALMVNTPSWTGTRIPNAPDNQPPLRFLLETTQFLGAITVPLALLLLGSSFARLKMPSSWRDVPVAAIVSMTVTKMVIVPLFSVFVILALRQHTTMFPPDQKIRTFVAILLSGTPAATNQLVVTQLYNPEGTAHTLASFLLFQYALMFILSTALAAVALYIVQ